MTLPEGILFTTYATLRSDDRGDKVSRVRQIVEWLYEYRCPVAGHVECLISAGGCGREGSKCSRE
ncbi:hypothetical protein FGU64_21655 [Mesorhizobium sp. 8]|nr:hypothetical protein FGU64_21655 [Mesorhizobium sp. 8]